MNRYLMLLWTVFVISLTACGDSSAASKGQIFEALLTSQRAAGVTLSGGKAYFYVPGTTTYKTIYADRNKVTPAANPYTLSSDGTAMIYGDGLYDVKITNSAGVQKFPIWEDVQLRDALSTFIEVSTYAELLASVTSADALGGTVRVTAPIVVTSAIAWPSDRELSFAPGGYVTFTGSGALTGLKNARAEWFGVIDGVADEVQINKALDSMRDQLGGTLQLSGSYTIAAPIRMTRGIRVVGDSMESTKIINNADDYAFIFRKHGSANPLNCAIENLQITGTGNVANTNNKAIECAGGAQYASIRNVKIYNMGSIGLDFNDTDSDGVTPLTGDLNGASSARGMLFSTFDNVIIEKTYSYGLYMTGNSAQNTFIKMRIISPMGTAGIKFISNDNDAGVLVNTFIGGGVESGGVFTAGTGFKAVWFAGSTLYAANNTKFLNFYIEPGVSVANAATTVYGYYIEAASGVSIDGGYISFCHEGVTVTGEYADNVVVENAYFFNSNSFNGAANLAGKYAVNKTHNSASLIMGPGNRFFDATTGSAWGTINPAQTVLGFTDIENDLNNSLASSMWVKGTSARVIGTNTGGANTILLRSYAADNTTETSRVAITGGTDVATVDLTTSDLFMGGTDTGSARGRITGVHSLGFNARTSANVANSRLFVDSADNKLKFKDSSGVVNLLY